MKKVFVCCKPEEKPLSYAAIVRRGAFPLDPGPVLATLPPDISQESKAVIIRESIAGADEVWVVGDEEPAAEMQELISGAAKPVKNILFESAAAAAPAPKPKFSVVLLHKDAGKAADNFTEVFATETDAFEYMQALITSMAEESKGLVSKIADDKKSGYVALERKLICTAYILPII